MKLIYNHACNRVYNFEEEQAKLKSFLQSYKVLKSLYLMSIYLSGWDEHNEDKKNQENFIGVSFFNGLDFKILEQLKAENLLKFSSTRKTLRITKQGIKQARDILKTINLDGVDILLEQRKYHEEYINYQSESDVCAEELE